MESVSDVPAADPADAYESREPASQLIELTAEVVAAYEAGLTVSEIAQIYRVDPRRVDALVAESGASPPRKRRGWFTGPKDAPT